MTALPFSLLPEEGYNDAMEQVLARLAQRKAASGMDERLPGQGIYWEQYEPEGGSDRVVFISHGFTESTLEYAELTWYFLQAGYGVFLCDHMGHGKSYRLLEETWLHHAVCFDDYVQDLRHLVTQEALPRSRGKRRYLFGHSMGGAIVILYLEQYPGNFDRCVLCAPMVMPAAGGFPNPLGRALVRFMCAAGQGEKPLLTQHPFDGVDRFETSCVTSRARYLWYLERKREDKCRQNTAATYSWAREAIGVQAPILARARTVQVPVLLCQAGLDTVVLLPPQDDLAVLLPRGRKIVYHTAKHEIYRSGNDVLEQFLSDILGFLAQ
ncbi:MAG: alpha/beta hydrolase [Clostridiales bacterium]|nr:alpha/beta hydrolase [Clostridiales bacterium]